MSFESTHQALEVEQDDAPFSKIFGFKELKVLVMNHFVVADCQQKDRYSGFFK
jgi:hypothetical protein